MLNNPQITQMGADYDRDKQTYTIIGAAMMVHKGLVFNLRESAKFVDNKS